MLRYEPVTAKWRWDSTERAAWEASLLARECPECGSEMRWVPYREVWLCRNYGGCELAPG